MTTIQKMPITNVFGQSDYSATLHLGSEKSPLIFCLIPIVSSTKHYLPSNDEVMWLKRFFDW